MLPSLADARKSLVFPAAAAAFRADSAGLVKRIQTEAASAEPGLKFAALALAADLSLDLRSFLTAWVLDGLVKKDGLGRNEIDQVALDLAAVVRQFGSPEQSKALADEAASIAKSETRRMCEETRNGKLATPWGHDYCTGMDHSLRRGARFVTSNPAKINLFRKENPEIWARFAAEARKENPGAPVERLVSALFAKVTAMNARVLRPIFDATSGEDGFVCVQVSPKNLNDAKKMTDEVMYWEGAYRKELGVDVPNVVYKLPAVKAAEETARDLVARGIRVCMTLNFTVSQHEIFADIIQKGERNGFVVLMAGFLDDNVAKELEGMGVKEPKQYAKWAGVAVMRKSYANLVARKADKAAIMAAAIRGPYTIACCLTDKPAAPVYFTTMTEKIKEFDAEPRPLKPEMREGIPADVMTVLSKSAIFTQAYNRDKLDMDGVAGFVPLQAVLKVFTEAYVEIEKSLA